jgi:hypothetical protein
MAVRKNDPNETREAAPTDGGGDSGDDAGQKQVQSAMDQEQEQGFRGIKVDPTPDSHYTVEGVTSGKPTPETDADAAAAAKKGAGL